METSLKSDHGAAARGWTSTSSRFGDTTSAAKGSQSNRTGQLLHLPGEKGLSENFHFEDDEIQEIWLLLKEQLCTNWFGV